MTGTRILLASFESPDINNLIPPGYAQDYKKLVSLAQNLFSDQISEASAEVHFHITQFDIDNDANACNARLIPELWNEGEYFGPEYATAGELYVYAHFLSKRASADLGQLLRASTELGFPELDSGMPIAAQSENGDLFSTHFTGGPIGSWDYPFVNLTAADFGGPIPQEVSWIQSSTTSSPLSTPPPTPPSTSPFLKEQFMSSYNVDDYPALPEDATPEGYLRGREAALVDNSRDQFLTSNRDMESLSTPRREQIAKARLAAGKYGVKAHKPCDFCQKLGKECRILHPLLFTKAWAVANKNHPKIRLSSKCAHCCNQSATKCNAA